MLEHRAGRVLVYASLPLGLMTQVKARYQGDDASRSPVVEYAIEQLILQIDGNPDLEPEFTIAEDEEFIAFDLRPSLLRIVSTRAHVPEEVVIPWALAALMRQLDAWPAEFRKHLDWTAMAPSDLDRHLVEKKRLQDRKNRQP